MSDEISAIRNEMNQINLRHKKEMAQLHIRLRAIERQALLSEFKAHCISTGMKDSESEKAIKALDSFRRSKNTNGSINPFQISDPIDILLGDDLPFDYRTEDEPESVADFSFLEKKDMPVFSDSWEAKCVKFKEQNNIPKEVTVMPKTFGTTSDISSAPIIRHPQAKQVVAEPTRLQQATSFVKKAAIAAPVAVAAGYVAKKAYDSYNASEIKTTEEVVDWNSIFSPPVSSEPIKQEQVQSTSPLLPRPSKSLPALVDSSFKDKTFDSADSAYESMKRYF